MGEPIMPAKHCKKCQAETERNKRGECKACVQAYAAAWRAANSDNLKVYRLLNKDKRMAAKAIYRAANKEKTKASDAAYRVANADKIKASRAARHAANPEKAKSHVATWKAANPEAVRIMCHNYRARKAESGGVLSPGLAARLFKLQGGKCPCCKQPLGKDFHLDHKMPLALGGLNIDDNIQLLCQRCNSQKGSKHPVDFMQSRGYLL